MYTIQLLSDKGISKVADYEGYGTSKEVMESLAEDYGKTIENGGVIYPKYIVINESGRALLTSVDPELCIGENLTRIDLLSDFRVYWDSIPECFQGLGELTLLDGKPLVGLDLEELKIVHKKNTNYFKNPLFKHN